MSDPNKVYGLIYDCLSDDPNDGTKGTRVTVGFEAVYATIGKLMDERDAARYAYEWMIQYCTRRDIYEATLLLLKAAEKERDSLSEENSRLRKMLDLNVR